jgi:hypothetical protein
MAAAAAVKWTCAMPAADALVRTADDNMNDIGDDHGDRAAEMGDAAPAPAAGPPPHSRPRWSH